MQTAKAQTPAVIILRRGEYTEALQTGFLILRNPPPITRGAKLILCTTQQVQTVHITNIEPDEYQNLILVRFIYTL